jgi:RPA family protein
MEARAFKNLNIARSDCQVNDDLRDKWTTELYPESVSQILDDEKAQEEYEKATQLQICEELDSSKTSGFKMPS